MPQRPAVGGAEPPPRIAPLPDAGWSDGDGARADMFDHAEPQMPEPPPRPARPSFADEVRRPAPPPMPDAPTRADPLAGFAPEPLGGRPEPPPRAAAGTDAVASHLAQRAGRCRARRARRSRRRRRRPRARTRRRAAAAAARRRLPRRSRSADQNLAEMAQRLEAALRRPAGDARTARRRAAGRARTAARPRRAAQRAAAAPPRAAPKSGFENLEDEMASLAGPPKDPFVRPATAPRRVLFFLPALTAAGSLADPALAQDISINLGGGGGGVTERAIQLIALLTVLSIAPSILVMMTSFTRIVVVLSLLRTALGTATAPPNSVIIALALFLTALRDGAGAAEILRRRHQAAGRQPDQRRAGASSAPSVPLRGFMQKNVREKDLKLFIDLSRRAAAGDARGRCRCASWCRPS